MKYLFYFYSDFNPVFLGVLLDEAIEYAKKQENEVLFACCGGTCELCHFNRNGSKPLCKFCSYTMRKVLNYYRIKSVSLANFVGNKDVVTPEYNTAKELRALQYRKVNIGLGVMSSYISLWRNMNPKLTGESRRFFDAHLKQNMQLVNALYGIIEGFRPDIVYSFNGRYEEVRPVYDICRCLSIKFYLGEAFLDGGKTWRKVFFEDHLPHDIKYWCKRRDYSWEHYNLTEEEKVKLGKSFYENRRNGIYAGDKIYTKNMVKGKIPDLDETKINIGIINSSEDEYAAVGEDWDRLKFFPTQYDGIIYMLEHAAPNVHYYLRIHPNLAKIPYRFHTDLLKLGEKYDSITVIPGDSEISTYDLMDHMNKIVGFGSTMGIESVYWGKPVINLGPALYSYDDICYEPKDLADLDRLLIADLKPKYNETVLKYGVYSMNQDPVIINTYNIDFQLRWHNFLGMKYYSTPYISFAVNSSFTGFWIALGRFLLGQKIFCQYEIPKEEDLNY